MPGTLPAALGALSSAGRPVLRALKGSVAQFHGGGFDLCPVSFSFDFPLFLLSSLVSEAASQGSFRHLQSGSRLTAELGISSCFVYGRGFVTWCLENLGVWVSLLFWLFWWQLLIFSVVALSSAPFETFFPHF